MQLRIWNLDFSKSQLFRLLILFLAITGAVSLLSGAFHVEFGGQDFWQYRGIFFGFWFLFFISVFPRLTLLFSSVPFGGLFWWLGFIFAPRLLVACLATINYWKANPLLVLIAWLVALGGESTEKVVIARRSKMWRRPPGPKGSNSNGGGAKDGTVEVEYRVTE